MKPAPPLSPVLGQEEQKAPTANEPWSEQIRAMHAQVTMAHQEHLAQVARLDRAYQEAQLRLLDALAGNSPATPIAPRRSFTRSELELHASGRVSDVFGPAFKIQDEYSRQVRMPEPPLLLVDRVTAMNGEPGSMGLGSITTETTVTETSWYLHQGRMPGGLAIEAGQADLMLISWLGIDRLNQGERVYRLLGCELSFSGGLPEAGETLEYNIYVDGHASHAGVRIFFFHYDCTSGGRRRLVVRNGQAGFFTDDELATSEGVLWTAEDAPRTSPEKARTDRGRHVTSLRSFDAEQVCAFGEGRPFDCFGAGFERALTHTRTPRTQSGRLQLLQTIPVFEPDGGPWKRGYLRAEWKIRPDDWFFQGHFKNDPCMPGTLMFEGCLQALAFYLSALGFTLDRDGWRFEPVPEQNYSLRCRGQALPSSRLLVFEIFVDEITAAPVPAIYADVLCTVDGLKAFHCPRLGLQLVPSWPLDELKPEQSANVPFDFESLMACALGRPSNAFGAEFKTFDGAVKVPRLPGDPYHFMSRVLRAGSTDAETEYDVPPDAWYFNENGCEVMPVSVLTEVLLQPCGWLASFAGTWKHVRSDIYFRNLDGAGTVHSEVTPLSGTLHIRVSLKSCSEMGAMSITAFEIACHAGSRLIFEGSAVFGHFPAAALANQTGLAADDAELQWLLEQSSAQIDLPLSNSLPRIGKGKLQMIDRISGYWPDGGPAGLGLIRAEFDVDPRQWFFKAHFFGDPVQPGSLGLEAVAQTLQVWMLATNRHAGMRNPRFEPIAVGERISWTYRGQVVPENKRVMILLTILEVRDSFARASASLWVDGTKVYVFPDLAMRLVEAQPDGDSIEELDPLHDTWLCDHCPTYTIPVLPMMSIVDRLAAAVHRTAMQGAVVELRDVTLNGWIAFPQGSRRLKTNVLQRGPETFVVTLSLWREAPHAALSRYDVMATAQVRIARNYPEAPPLFPPLAEAAPVPLPYGSGELFHGIAFHFVQSLSRSNEGSSFLIDSSKGGVPRGFLDQGLFDGITHGIPNEHLRLWSDRIPANQVGYPSRILRFAFFAAPPADGISQCEVRFAGFHDNDDRFPQFRAQLIAGGRVWAELDLVYVLFAKGPIGNAPAQSRRDFLQYKKYVPGIGLGQRNGGEMYLVPEDLYQSDWLPGTVDNAFGLNTADRLSELAVKQHIARLTQIHPANIPILDGGQCGTLPQYPLNRFPVEIVRDAKQVKVRSAETSPLDCSGVRQFWQQIYGLKEWPVADFHTGLIERFVRRLEIIAPADFASIQGKPALFLGNHQVAVESILFNVLLSAVLGAPIKVIAKKEHRQSWIGRLIELTQQYPGVRTPEPILFFDRSDPRALLDALSRYRTELQHSSTALMVHVDGTRALSCRTPVSQVSSVFVDLALELSLPIVPIRFVGGLPIQPASERLEFPFGLGQQDIRIGTPIFPDSLGARPFAERTKTVMDAINALAPENETSFATEACPAPIHTVLADSLRFASHHCTDSNLLLASLDGAEVRWPDGPRGEWLQAFKSWLESPEI
jgi:3-hydroxymyristoyl/3-hydroxydecanoyl-(acyl carrier protein) dehydratase/1-acyl-sn-glycerol-3-phosphate acyltransferase